MYYFGRRKIRRARRAPSSAFAPTDIAGIDLWLRADLGITLNGGDVSAWADQSGTGDANKNAAQAVGASQPLYVASDAGYNGQPTIQFNGLTDFLFSAAWSTPPTTVGSMFIVGECAIDTVRVFGCLHSIGGIGELYNNGIGSTDLHYYQGSDFAVVGEAALNAKHVYLVDRNGASTSVYQDAKTALTTGNGGSGACERVVIGSNALAASLPLDGKIAEWIMYTRILDATERGQVLDYLGARYGVTIGA